MAVKPVPEGFHTVTPYLLIQGVPRLLEFLKQAFGAEEKHRSMTPDGRVMHAEVRIGDSPVMMGEVPNHWQPMSAGLYMYVPDVDALYQRATSAGATSINEPRDEFYGDRVAGVKDPVGNTWWIATHKEDVAPEEMARRMEAEMKKRAGK